MTASGHRGGLHLWWVRLLKANDLTLSILISSYGGKRGRPVITPHGVFGVTAQVKRVQLPITLGLHRRDQAP